MRRSFIAALLLLAASSLFAQTPDYIPIAAARHLKKGNVTVLGLVTVRPGQFSSSSGDQGFAIQDQTGGIWVSLDRALPLRVGQLVRVSGPLRTSHGKLEIKTDARNVQTRAGNQLRVATGQVGAATLGFMISVEGKITQRIADGQDGFKLMVDDGSGPAQVYLNASTDIDPNAPHLAIGRRIRVTGFGNVYADKKEKFTAYEVDPRSRADIEPLR